MTLIFPTLKGFDRLAQNTLVRLRPERVGFFSDYLKGKTLANHGLAQKETHGACEVKSCFCEELVGIVTKVGVNADLQYAKAPSLPWEGRWTRPGTA